MTCISASTSTKPCDSFSNIIVKWDTLLNHELDSYGFSLHVPPINTFSTRPQHSTIFYVLHNTTQNKTKLPSPWWVFVCRLWLMQNRHGWSRTMFQRVTWQFTLEMSKRRGLWFQYHIWSTLCFWICWTKQKKSLGSTIPWGVSRFLAKKTLSSISLLECVPSETHPYYKLLLIDCICFFLLTHSFWQVQIVCSISLFLYYN